MNIKSEYIKIMQTKASYVSILTYDFLERDYSMNCNKSVSAVITTYNRCYLLERAVNSVLVQTYKPEELVIVDDGSTDNTEEYVKSLSNIDISINYIKIKQSEKKGGNHARNIGIKAAKGEYIAFLDDDDEWFPNKTALQMKCFELNPQLGAVSSDLRYIYVIDGKKYVSYSNVICDKTHKYGFFVNSWLNVTSTIIARKEVLEYIGGFDEKMPAIQEIELSYRICLHFPVDIVKQPLINYYQYMAEKKQITNSVEKYISALRLIEEKYKVQISSLHPSLIKEMRNNQIQNIAYRYFRNNQMKEYRREINKTFPLNSIQECFRYILSFFMDNKKITIVISGLSNWKRKIKGKTR